MYFLFLNCIPSSTMNNSINDDHVLGLFPIQLSSLNPYSLLHLFDYLGFEKNQQSFIYTANNQFVIPNPLYSNHGNALNPEFVEFVGSIINVSFALFMLIQLYQLTITRKTTTQYIYIPTPKSQSLKLFLVFVSIVSYFSIFQFNNNGTLIGSLVTVILALVLHFVEFRQSAIAIASLLLFWFVNSLFLFGILIQDSYSDHYIYAKYGTTAYILEIILFINNLIIFILEVGFYKPGFEIANGENFLDTINLFSYFTIYYLQPLINKIYTTNNVTLSDLPDILGNLNCEETKAIVNRSWAKELKNSNTNNNKGRNRFSLSSIWACLTRKKIEYKPTTPNMLKTIINSFPGKFLLTIILGIIETCLSFAQPFLLRKFIQFFNLYFYTTIKEEKPPIIIGYFLSMAMFIVSIANFIISNQVYKIQYDLGYGISSSLTSIVYEKALKLSPQSRKNKPTGSIINTITMDISIIVGFCQSLGEYLSSPLKLIVCLVLLYQLFANATWVGFIAALISAPLASLINVTITNNYLEMMKNKDERTSLITEILNSAKSIKFYSWETPMLERLAHIRNDKELVNIRKIGVVIAFAQFIFSCIPFIISCSTYTAFTIFYKVPLTPDIIFPALALFGLLLEPMAMIPSFIVQFTQASTCLSRISELLCLDELEDDDQHGYVKRYLEPNDDDSNSIYSVMIKNATFVWSHNKDKNETSEYKDEESEIEHENPPINNIALKDINFLAKQKELTCVVGKVGAGKSILIKAILGDVPIKIPAYSDDSTNLVASPSVETFGSIAYCPQNPWILNGTVKDNILFGHKYDPKFYKQTIDACELISDFKNLADGDQTIVGEKGISLSGGQKARISLARSVYARADIYLLDDILSAVDSHVGKNIIKKVLSNDGIIGSRCRILATNSVPVLHEANDIYLLSNGSIVEHGDFDSVMSRGGELANLIKEYGRKKDEESNIEEQSTTINAGATDNNKDTITDVDSVSAIKAQEIVEFAEHEESEGVVRESPILRRASIASYNHNYKDENDNDELIDGQPRKTKHQKEVSKTGIVSWDIFKQYIVACDYKYFSIYIIATLTVVLVSTIQKYLLSYWSQLNNEHNETVSPVLFLGSYALLGVFSGFLSYLGSYVIWTYCIVKGAAYFHNKMAEAVLRSPVSFFETTPVGRILNRFTDDIGYIDLQFPMIIISFVTTLLNGIVTFGVILTFLPLMLLIIVVLLFVYNYIRSRYIAATIELKRLLSVTKSPVLDTIQESINGVETIKAFHQKERFIHKSKKHIDKRTLVSLVKQDSVRWLLIRLQFISSSILFSTALLAVVKLGGKNPILPSILGFVMAYSMSITYTLNSLITVWAELQSGGVAVERIIEYCDLDSEAPMVIKDKRPANTWPHKGVVKFKKYSTTYRKHLDPVLKEIELTINSKEKVGIVGRTGAGKSSLTLALFRIIEATSGNIEIDGVNIGEIGLYDLRHHLTIIPQEAHTFKASVRENLDPFGEYSDDKLWKVLELAHLKEHVAKMETDPTEEEKKASKNPDELSKKVGLDAQIEEGGSNLSSGQKQLLCLARALLNETSKILVLDEATAAVDFQTDKIIQATIRNEFKDKTILTIAHRIDTILDSDRILVLDNGEIAEFDTPGNLLKNKNSIFYSLAKEGGYIN
ncbi:hypothetical protein MG7_01235 [Candida albicans P34048]|nr:hypothetical protein MG7_01235 [Candida albicans P34048]